MINHLQNFGQEFSRNFPDLESKHLPLVTNLFNFQPDSVSHPDQDEYLEIKFDSGVKDLQKRALCTGIQESSKSIIP